MLLSVFFHFSSMRTN